MTEIPKIQVEELIAKYEFHPEIMGIIVEGEFDKDFLSTYFESNGSELEATILPIDLIDFHLNTTNSNKETIIALSTLIESKLNGIKINSLFVVDTDTDKITSRVRRGKYLQYTDYTSMEMYLYSPATLKKFFTLACNLKLENRDEFMSLADCILPCIFAARAVNDSAALFISVPNFSTGLESKGSMDSFSQEKYLNVFLSLIIDKKKKDEAKLSFGNIIQSFKQDLREKAHGHDFVTLLFEYLWTKSSLKLHNKKEDVLKFGGRLLGTALIHQEVSATDLFRRLNSKFI